MPSQHPVGEALRPGSVAEAAELIASRGAAGVALCPTGSSSRLPWGAGDPAGVALETAALHRILRHDAADFTAELEAGLPLAAAQAAFAEAGQWLALDPPPAPSGGAGTIGGLVATADSGPARHRFGGVRDLVIGITVVLSDGTIAKAGGNVIKNVAGYDLGKLFTGSYGTLGLIATVTVRLHPLPAGTATATGVSADPRVLSAVAIALARRPLEALSLDAAWRDGQGSLLVRFAGVTAAEQATTAAKLLAGLDEVRVIEDDGPLWTDQAAAQRSGEGAVVAVSGLPTDLPEVLAAARDAGGTAVSRAALGLSWLALPPGPDLAARVGRVRTRLAPRPTTILDGAGRSTVDSGWPAVDPGALAVMERVKARFDPMRIFRPGCYVGGI
jgi:glycolate oxidase FAD binding subunit